MTVRYEMKDDAVALITLNRPQALNAFNADMRRDLQDAVARASADKAVRAFIITGAGNAVNFTDGLDGLAIGPVMIAGATFGFIAYVGIKLLSGRWSELNAALVILAVLFVLKFALL